MAYIKNNHGEEQPPRESIGDVSDLITGPGLFVAGISFAIPFAVLRIFGVQPKTSALAAGALTAISIVPIMLAPKVVK